MRHLRRRSVRPAALASATALLLAVACVVVEPVVIPNPHANITGEWAFHAADHHANVGCSAWGSLFLTDSGGVLTGTAYQLGPCGYPRTAPVTAGTIDSGRFSLKLADCTYSGTAYGTAEIRLTGTVFCTERPNYYGDWYGERTTPPFSISIAPSARTIVQGGTVSPRVDLRDSHGLVVGRPLTWSSDNPQVATVSDTGLIEAIAPGTATVTVAMPESSATLSLRVVEPVRFTSVSAGSIACGVTTDGRLFCWGPEYLGDGSGVGSTAPIDISAGLTWSAVSAGYYGSSGLTSSGAAYAWGIAPPSPRPPGSLSFTTLSGGDDHVCGIAASGATYCWGGDLFGELGNGTTMAGSTAPVLVAGALAFTAVTAGRSHTCGLTADGRAYCWGANFAGQLGKGPADTAGALTPVAIAADLRFISLSAAFDNTCGVTTAGTPLCWGDNQWGQLGNGSATLSPTRNLTPVAGGLRFTSTSAGWGKTCGMTADDHVYCWGGRLPSGDWATVPEPVAPGLTFSSVSAGYFQACGLATDGIAYCWGAVPVRVVGQR